MRAYPRDSDEIDHALLVGHQRQKAHKRGDNVVLQQHTDKGDERGDPAAARGERVRVAVADARKCHQHLEGGRIENRETERQMARNAKGQADTENEKVTTKFQT